MFCYARLQVPHFRFYKSCSFLKIKSGAQFITLICAHRNNITSAVEPMWKKMLVRTLEIAFGYLKKQKTRMKGIQNRNWWMLRVRLRAIWHLVDAAGAAEQLTVTQARSQMVSLTSLRDACWIGINKSNGTIHPTSPFFRNAKNVNDALAKCRGISPDAHSQQACAGCSSRMTSPVGK